MSTVMRSLGLYVWAIVIALVLWVQVHGQGEGSLSMDVSLQVQGLPENMVIVNDFPDQVKITVHGLQGRLKTLDPKDVFISVSVDDLQEPGVVERALSLQEVRLPPGIEVDKIQPDRIELQIDHIVERNIPVQPLFDVPQGWLLKQISIEPKQVRMIGPEVWMDTLTSIETVPLRLPLTAGTFDITASVVSPAGKAVRLENENVSFHVRGLLLQDKEESSPVADGQENTVQQEGVGERKR